MRGKIFLVLLITIMIGIQPVFAQSGSGGSGKPAAQGKAVKEVEVVININLASDSEFIQALEAAGDVELINEETAKAKETKTTEIKTETKTEVKTGVSGKDPSLEK